MIPSMAAISQIGQMSAVNIPVTKKRQPRPIGFLFLYMGKPPVILYAKGEILVTEGREVDRKKIWCYTKDMSVLWYS